MKCILGKDVSNALIGDKRVYLCGNLQNPSKLKHYETTGYEVGISRYSSFTCESAHYHATNTEYNYVLCGAVKVYIFDEEKEYLLSPGDMFIIEPNMTYITKAIAGTDVLFSKVPGGNDKVLSPESEKKIADWMKQWD